MTPEAIRHCLHRSVKYAEQIVPDKYRPQIRFVLVVFSLFLLFLFSKICCYLAQTGNTQLHPYQHSMTWKRPLFAAAGYGSLSCLMLPANRGSNTQALGRPSDNPDVSSCCSQLCQKPEPAVQQDLHTTRQAPAQLPASLGQMNDLVRSKFLSHAATEHQPEPCVKGEQ